MSTVIRPELSKHNKYWIERHRYYELKHFCLQYPEWRRLYLMQDGLSKPPSLIFSVKNGSGDPTGNSAVKNIEFIDKMKLIENLATDVGYDLATYIFIGVTEGLSYEKLKARLDIPCCRDVYYEMYRKFFWKLDKLRENYTSYNGNN